MDTAVVTATWWSYADADRTALAVVVVVVAVAAAAYVGRRLVRRAGVAVRGVRARGRR